jgi:histidyl-tRNA synthetase
MEIKAIRGFNDILPNEIGKWHFVEKTAREIFEGFGFSEIRIPILERTELFARGIGEASLKRRCTPFRIRAVTL